MERAIARRKNTLAGRLIALKTRLPGTARNSPYKTNYTQNHSLLTDKTKPVGSGTLRGTVRQSGRATEYKKKGKTSVSFLQHQQKYFQSSPAPLQEKTQITTFQHLSKIHLKNSKKWSEAAKR